MMHGSPKRCSCRSAGCCIPTRCRPSLVTTKCRQPDRRPAPTAVLDSRGWCRLNRVDIDPIVADTERMQAVALGGEILLFC